MFPHNEWLKLPLKIKKLLYVLYPILYTCSPLYLHVKTVHSVWGILLNMLQGSANYKKVSILKFVLKICSHTLNRQNYPYKLKSYSISYSVHLQSSLSIYKNSPFSFLPIFIISLLLRLSTLAVLSSFLSLSLSLTLCSLTPLRSL